MPHCLDTKKLSDLYLPFAASSSWNGNCGSGIRGLSGFPAMAAFRATFAASARFEKRFKRLAEGRRSVAV